MTASDLERAELERELGDRYQLVRALGRGAFGTVWLARELQLHRPVAIKVLHTERAWNDEERERLLREARTIGQLSHPAIVPLLTFGETSHTVYLVMPFVTGESLADRLAREGRLDPREARRILIEVADALAYAHGEGVLHRDLKPENVLLERAGAVGDDVPPRARLIDFGVAAFPMRDRGVGAREEAWGTPHFMAPEQAFGEPTVDPRTELYSFGVLGYLLLGGRVPFDATRSTDRLIQQRAGPRVALGEAAPNAPRDLVELIEQCLSYDPADRPRRARDVRDALVRGAVRSADASSPMTILRQRLRPKRAPRRRAAVPNLPRVRTSPRLVLEETMADVRFALRTFARRPLTLGIAALSIALGIGASTAMFSVVDTVLLRPLPFSEPERLVSIYPTSPALRGHPTMGGMAERATFSWPELWDVHDAATAFDGIAAYRRIQRMLDGAGTPHVLQMAEATPALFRILGVRPLHGTLFDENMGVAESRVVLLSHALWRSRFGSSPEIVGRAVMLDDEPYTAIGVLPPWAGIGTVQAEAWIPRVRLPQDRGGRGNHMITGVVGRLRDGVTIEQARDDVTRILAATTPPGHGGIHGGSVFALHVDRTREVRPALLVLLAGAVLLLGVGCANVAAILLGAGLDRRHEIALRGALGAGGTRIARQLLTESMALAAVGAAGGLLIAAVATRLLVLVAPPGVPRIAEAALDWRVAGFACLVAAASGVLFGLAPALTLARAQPATSLASSRGVLGGRGVAQAVVVVGELALATVLLVGGTLLVRTLLALERVDPGFRAEEVIALEFAAPMRLVRGMSSDSARRFAEAYVLRVADELATVPGVRGVALTSTLPLTPSRGNNGVEPEGWDEATQGRLTAERRFVSVNFFETMGIRLIQGRTFGREDDRASGPLTMIISEGLARRAWPGQSAVGKRVRFYAGEASVVGVVADQRDEALRTRTELAFYVPMRQHGVRGGGLAVRTTPDVAALIPSLRSRINAVDPSIAITRLEPYTELLSAEVSEERYRARLMVLFAGLALAMAGMGVYGVTARSVARRTREFGIRMALGAEPKSVLAGVLANGVRLAVIGAAVGLVVALAGGRLIEGLLYGVSATDPVSLTTIAVVVCGLSLLAALGPARRATRVDPIEALRSE